MTKLRIAICEDTEEDIRRLGKLLDKNTTKLEYDIFHSGEELLALGKKLLEYDLFLIDIYMKEVTGVAAAKEIRSFSETVPIAFITTSLEHSLESYRLGVLKYIEKPIEEKDLQAILELAFLKKENQPALQVKKNKKLFKIPFREILYLEQNNHTVSIYQKNGEVLEIYNKLSTLLEQLEDDAFVQTHQSFIVNLNYVLYLDKELRCFKMTNQKNVYIRREDLSKMKKRMESFYFQQIKESL